MSLYLRLGLIAEYKDISCMLFDLLITSFPEFLNLPVVDGSAYLSLYCSDGLGDLHGCSLHVLGGEAIREDGEQGGAGC